MRQRFILLAGLLVIHAVHGASSAPAVAQTRVRDICRVKGQEENTLQGLGLVVGLKGTGDSDMKPTTRALARMMTLMGNPLPRGERGEDMLQELKDAKNVALVFVTVTVPGAGARQGDALNCEVNAISAKSLDGGYLMMTPLLGPRPGSPRVYGFAQGALHLEDPSRPVSAKVHNGCRLEETFQNAFVENDTITLVVDKNHANFQTAQDIAELINSQPDFGYNQATIQSAGIATAKDQVNIEVRIPGPYVSDPVLFVSLVLNQHIYHPQNDARVIVNQRAGTVIIGADVEIGPVAVTHKNITIEAGPFFPLEPATANSTTKLKALVDALNAIKATPQDIIDIIKGLDRNGDLYGRLIIE